MQQALQGPSLVNWAAVAFLFGILVMLVKGSFLLGRVARTLETLVPDVKEALRLTQMHEIRLAVIEAGTADDE